MLFVTRKPNRCLQCGEMEVQMPGNHLVQVMPTMPAAFHNALFR
jgi:hypothetical protein